MKKLLLSTCLLCLLVGASIKTNAQTCGIVEPLTPVALTQGPNDPNGLPTVNIPYLAPDSAGIVYSNAYFTYNANGQPVPFSFGCIAIQYSPQNPGYVGLCVGCHVSDFPPIYRITTLNCSLTSSGPCYTFDSTVSLTTNPYTSSVNWSNPLTWDYYKTPIASTIGLSINKAIQLDVDYKLTTTMVIDYGSIFTINQGSNFTCGPNSYLTISNLPVGKVINNGNLRGGCGIGGSQFINNGLFAPGENGIGRFVFYQKSFFSSTGTSQYELASKTSYDQFYSLETAALDGKLEVKLLNGFKPVLGDKFKIMEFSASTGTFSTSSLPALTSGLSWKIRYNPTNVTLEVLAFPTFSTTTATTDAACFGTLGTISATISGGTPPYGYKISGNAAQPYLSSNSFAVTAGSYHIYFTDANGFRGVTGLMTVGQPLRILPIVANKKNVTCYGGADGFIVINPTNGIAPFQYKLGATGTYGTSNSFLALRAASYRLYIKDAGSCVDNIVTAITQPVRITATYTKTDETCPLARDGSATVTGANGADPYQYRFGMGGTYSTTNSFGNLAKGNYRIYVTDNNGCGGISVVVPIVDINTTCLMAKNGTGNAMEKALSADNKQSLTVFPNPTKGAFTLQLNGQKTGKADIIVTSESGVLIENRSVKTTATNQLLQFNFANKAPGIYFIKVVSEQGVQTNKVVVE